MKSPFSKLFGMTDKQDQALSEADEYVELQEELDETEEVKQLNVTDIIPNRFQPRSIFLDEKIDELSQTIRTHGIIQPIVVREYEQGKYEIIAGERRWRAVTKLGWDKIPAIIKNLNDTETASVALIENLQREELSAIEEAAAYVKLIEIHGLTQEALAQRLGKGQSTIANKMRLLKLPQEVQEALLQKKISERHARALIALKDPAKQVQMMNEIIEKQFNVKQTEERIVALLEGNKKKAKPKPKLKLYSKDMRIALNTIRQSLTMVTKSGVNLDTDEEEFDDYYQFTIKIPKK